MSDRPGTSVTGHCCVTPFTARMVKVARSNFKGRITYGAASDLEQVDWSLFDIVGLDYYSYHANRADRTTVATTRTSLLSVSAR